MSQDTRRDTDAEGVVWSGGCHCGAVRYRVRVREHRAIECNCSMCRKKGYVHLIVDLADFELVRGAERLSTYTFGTHTARHHFCSTCGIHAWYVPRSHPDGVSVNVRCLDGDDPLARFTIEPFDGAHWEESIEALRAGDADVGR